MATRSQPKRDSAAAHPDAPSSGLPPIPDMATLLSQFNVPDLNLDAVLSARQRDLAALMEANQEAFAGVEAVTRRQMALAEEALEAWREAARNFRVGSPGALDQSAAQQAFGRLLTEMRELAEMSAQSQARVYQIVQKRAEESIAEFRALLGNGAKS